MYANRTWTLSLATLSCLFFSLTAAPTTITVNVYTDLSTNTGGLYGVNTDLRGALNHVNLNPLADGYAIVFQDSGQTISIEDLLPILNLVQPYPLTIDGGDSVPTIIDGTNTIRGLFAHQGNISLKNLQLQNFLAKGGRGQEPSGGGGAGLGAGLFVNNTAHVTLVKTKVLGSQSAGGLGALGRGTPGTGGGGGGLGGSGGEAQSAITGGGGGGGIEAQGGDTFSTGGGGGGGLSGGPVFFPAAGGDSGSIFPATPGGAFGTVTSPGGATGVLSGGGSGGGAGSAGGATGGGGGAGGTGGGGGGGIGGESVVGNNGGAGGLFGGGGGGSATASAIGGNGGFGGGGGGGATSLSIKTGGDGGFGGGGGGADHIGGNGGFGGGGAGGGTSASGGAAGIGGIGGGTGETPIGGMGQGGGGAGLGGGIFVNAGGSLTIFDTFSANGNSTTAGTGFSPGWAAGDDVFLLTGAAVMFDPNGSTITIANSIADDSSASFNGAPVGITEGTAAGVSITIGNPTSAPGTVSFLSTNASTYLGSTLVKNGIFALNGSIASPVTVYNGGKLQGVGSVLNEVHIQPGGTIHAGNSIGTFTTGNLIMTSGSIMELDIDLSSSSQYKVNGSLTINGATLSLLYASPSSFLENHAYDFIEYVGTSPVGTFNPVVLNTPLGLHPVLAYLPNLVSLQLVPFSDALGVGVTLSHNQKAVLDNLLVYSNVEAMQSVLNSLANLTVDELRAALDSISPARNGAAPYFANQTAFEVGRIPLVRLRDSRVLHAMAPQNKNIAFASAFAIKQEDLLALNSDSLSDIEQSVTARSDSKPAGRAKTAAASPERYGFWASGFGTFLTQEGQNSNPHLQDTAAGAVVGFDYYGYQNGLFNIAAGYIHNDITECFNTGTGTSNGAILSLYGTGYLGNGYLEGGVLGGYNQFDMSRNVMIGGSASFEATAKSSFNDWILMPHLGGGYDYVMNWGVVEPFASLDWAVSFQESYQEKGADPLNIKTKSGHPSILRSQLGLNLYETWDNESGCLLFEQSISYVNKAFFSTHMHSLILVPTVNNPTPFTVSTYDKTLNLAGVNAELFYKHKKSGFFVSGAYAGEFGSHYISNNITGTLGVFF